MIKLSSAVTTLIATIAICWSIQVLAHAEHDKPRYVAEDGADNGRCDNMATPCKTIAYAAQHANKGDRILVASGNYEITDVTTLFYLIGDVVPVKGGYSTKQFKRSISENPTRLIGVPLEYADELTAKGFTVIVDRKGMEDHDSALLAGKLDVLEHLKTAQTNQPCTNGKAGTFPCSNLDLVAHMPLSDLGGQVGNDVWGHYDLNDAREYALMGLTNGVAVVDVTTPETPRLVTHIPGQNTTWRDIKVLQYYDALAARWKAYAYVTADNASVGLQILDLTHLPDSVTIAKTDKSDLSAHNVYLSNVDYSTNTALSGLTPYLHIAGSNNNGGAFNTFSLINPASPAPTYRNSSDSRNNYSHDLASMSITDARKDNQCVNASAQCEVLFDFNENEVRLWDKTNNQQPIELSRTRYSQAEYVHSGWWSEDKLVMMVHDELDEQIHNLNTTLRFFDISDLQQPVLISTYTGPTTAIDHNGFVRGNRYYMSNYERGLTVLDISNPNQPKDAGFFDTYPISNLPAFNGAWGTYPFLPSGLILVSDINSGLYLVRDKTLAVPQGTFSFTAQEYHTDEGATFQVTVTRTGGTSGAVSVGYETQTGSANSADFIATTGRLTWAAGDSSAKTFTVSVNTDAADEPDELFFVRLFDPRGSATLSSPSLARITINGITSKGEINLVSSALNVIEPDELTIAVERRNGGNGSLDVTLVPEMSASGIFTLTPATLTWEDGDTGVKYSTLTPVNDTSATGDRNFVIALSGTDLSTTLPTQVLVTIRDDESNVAPRFVNLNDTANVNGKTQVVISALATDTDSYPLTYHWEQVSGTSIDISPENGTQTSFVAPNVNETLVIRVTATDAFGASASKDFNVNVTSSSSGNSSSKSGGAVTWWLMGLLLTIGCLQGLRRSPKR